jgi:hypothetical protein
VFIMHEPQIDPPQAMEPNTFGDELHPPLTVSVGRPQFDSPSVSVQVMQLALGASEMPIVYEPQPPP